jgi:hypothetical protein
MDRCEVSAVCRLNCTIRTAWRPGPDPLAVRLRGLFGGAAPSHTDAGLNRADRGFAASNSLGQGHPQRPIALRQDCWADLAFGRPGARQTGQHSVDALLHRLAPACRLRGGERCGSRDGKYGSRQESRNLEVDLQHRMFSDGPIG